jgi:hypothetical protein
MRYAVQKRLFPEAIRQAQELCASGFALYFFFHKHSLKVVMKYIPSSSMQF